MTVGGWRWVVARWLFSVVQPKVELVVDAEPGVVGDVLRAVSGEAGAFRQLSMLAAVRAREAKRGGDLHEAAVLEGKAEAFSEAADHAEESLIEAMRLWDEYERQTPE